MKTPSDIIQPEILSKWFGFLYFHCSTYFEYICTYILNAKKI